MFVEAAAFAPLGHNGQVVLRHVAHEQQDVDMSCFPATRGKREEEEDSPGIKQLQLQLSKLCVHVVCPYLRTATSFLNAWNCSGVGSVTFRIFTATSPTTIILCSVTLDP